MKRFLMCAMVLVLVSISAFAKDNSEKLFVPMPVKAGSMQLAAGNYEVTWAGTGPDVRVTFIQNRKAIATVSAKLTEQVNKIDGVETSTRSGAEILDIVRLKTVTLTLENTAQ
jgi:hypothetical protein